MTRRAVQPATTDAGGAPSDPPTGTSQPAGLASVLGRWVAVHRRRILVFALLLTLGALWLVPRLRFDTDLVALLPQDSPAAADYRLFLQHFGGFEKVFIVVLPVAGMDPETSAADEVDAGLLISAAETLADTLRNHPEVARVRSGLEPEDEDFLLRQVVARAPLFLPPEALGGLSEALEPAALEGRARQLRSVMASPMGGWQVPFLIHDPLGLSDALQLSRRAGDGLPLDPLTSAFLASQENAALVVLTPSGAEIDPASGRRLQAALNKAFDEVRAEVGDGVRFAAVGGPLYAAQDETVLRQDLEATVAGSAVGCALLLLLAFGGPRQPLVIFASLGVALCWSLGLVVLLLGSLSAAGIGFAAVLVGLGVDYGIHGGTRFQQLILAGQSPAEALAGTFRHSGRGILVSALTTALAFAVLSLALFRPLRELGSVVALGILMILLAAALVGGALAVSVAQAGSGRRSWLWRWLGRWVEISGRQARRHAGIVLLLAASLTLASLVALRHLDVSADLRALRPADHPALEAEELLVEHFGVGLDTATVVLQASDLSLLLERTVGVGELLRRRLPGATVTSPGDWIVSPRLVEERLRELQALPWLEAAETFEKSLRQAGLSPQAFAPGLEALRAWGRGVDPATNDAVAVWPEVARELIRQPPTTGGVGTATADSTYWAALQLRLPKGAWAEGPPAELRRDIEDLAPGSAIASAVALGQDMRLLALRDLRRLGLIALLVMLTVVAVSFRGRWLPSLLALSPVLLGCCWTFGLWGALGLPLDLLSLAVLPILLGIGIDDGLHALHGMRAPGASRQDDEPVSSQPLHPLAESVSQAGRAMVLTTLTTAVGFASLTLSSVPGLQRGGALVSVGVFACLAATLWVLPAMEAWYRGRAQRDDGEGKGTGSETSARPPLRR